MRLLKNRNVASVLPAGASFGSLRGSTALTGGVVAALLSFAPLGAQAQVVWNGGTNTNALTGTNWVGNVAPTVGDQAQLNTAAGNQPTLGGATTYTGLAISAGTYTVGGAGTLTSPVTLSGTGNLSISAGGSITGLVTAGGATVSNSGTITGSLIVTAGTVTNAGVVSGTTTISGGILNLNGGSNLADALVLTVNGGTVNLNAAETVGGVILTGGSISGASLLTSATNFDMRSGTVSAPLGGAVGLDKSTAGTVTLTGANTYTGITTISDGLLNVTGAGSVVSAAVNVTGGTLTTDTDALGAGTTVTVSGTSTFTSSGTDTFTALTQTGGTVNGSGVLTLTGAFNQSGGATGGTVVINAATFTQSGGATIGAGTTVTSAGAQSLQGGTIAGSLNGAGAITVSAGTTTVTGAVSNAASITINGGGTLQVGNGGTTGTLGASAITNDATLTFNRSDAVTVSNAISGTGALNQNGAGTTTLSGANTYSGLTTITAGTLAISAANNLGNDSGTNGLVINGGTLLAPNLTMTRTVTIGAAGGTIDTGAAPNGTVLNGGVTFTGLLTKAGTGRLTLLAAGTGAGGIQVNAANLQIGNNTAFGTGTVTLGANASIEATTSAGLVMANNVVLDAAGSIIRPGVQADFTSSGIISGGTLIKEDGGALILTGANTYGSTTINTGTLQIGAGGTTGTLGTGNVISNGTLAFNRSDAITVSNVISGAGTINQIGGGTTTLTGASGAFAGITNANAGILRVNGTLASAASTLNVNVGGTLQGIGTVGGNVNVLGGTLAAGQSPGTLTIAGNLVLNGASVSAFELGQANVIGGANNDLVNVGGALTLDGTLNVTSVAPGFSNGFYRLYNYGGALTNNTLDIGTLPPGFTAAGTPVTVLTNVSGQVNLQVGAITDQFWDGAGLVGNGVINGGAGTWNAANTNWTNSPGADFNTNWQSVNGTFAGAAGGAVDVVGAQAFQQLNFTTAGYTLGGAGSLVTTGGFSIINTAVDAAINVPITGVGGLTKIGAGVLSLGGVSTYAGQTDINAGTLRTTVANALPTNTAVTISTGAILDLAGNNQTIGSLASAVGGTGSVTLGAATLTTGGNNTSTTFAGIVSGTGGLTKAGTGIFTLSGANTYTGATTINAGSLSLAGGAAIADSGAVVINGGNLNLAASETIGSLAGLAGTTVTLGSNTLTTGGNNTNTAFAGVMSGAGSLTKAGTGTFTLSGINTYGGVTSVQAGTLVNQGTIAGAVNNLAAGIFTNEVGATAGAVTNAGNTTNRGTVASMTNTAGNFGNVGTVTGASTISGGSVISTGAFQSTLGLTGGSFRNDPGATVAGLVTNNGGSVINNGLMPGGVTNTVGSFTNTATGTTGAVSNAALASNAGTIASLANTGGNFTNTGIVTGASTISGGGVDNSGAFQSTIGITNGFFTNNAGGTVAGLVTNSGVVVNNASMAGGVANGANGSFTNNATGTTGAVTNTGVASNAGTVASLVNTGSPFASFTNTGIIAGGATVTSGLLTTSGTINGGLTNSGTTTASGTIAGGVVNTGAFSVTGPLNNSGGDVTNNAPGTITLGAGTSFTNIATFTNNAAAANAVLVNAGASLSAGTLRHLAGTFTNLGTVTAPVMSNAATLASSGTLSGTTSFSNTGTVNASGTFNSTAATNTGVFTVQGNLGGVTTAFTNQAGGLVNLAGGNFTGVGTFNNAGTFQSTSGVARTLGAGTFNNQATGVINLANGSINDQLTITGAYAGTAGSQVRVDIDLSRADAGVRADKVVVAGAGSGASTITFNIINPNRTVFGTPIEVMTTGTGSVAVNEGEIVAARRGFFGYFLKREAAGAGSSYQVVSNFNSGPVAGVASGITGMISSLQAGFHQPASAIISRPDNCQPNQLTGGPFIRLSSGETTLKNSTTGDVAGGGSPFSGASKSATRFSGVQTGADIGVCNINNTGWNVHTGIMGGVVETSTSGLSRTPDPSGGTFSQTRTTAKVEVPFIGAYMFATNGAFTSEINIRKDFYNAKVSAFDPVSGFSFVGPGQKVKGNGLNFNASLSYRFSFAESWYIEPQVGFSKGTTRFSALQFSNSTTDFMTFRASDSMLGRVGLNVGTAVQATENLVVVPFVSAAIWHEFAKPTKAQAVFGSNGNQTFDVKTDRVGTFGQVGAGLQFRLLNTPFVGFIRADARFGSKIEGKAVNAGLRMQF